ncbi:MAG: glycoside hydrolase family 130 protein [Clostridia bacterium]|nr:glycoside hydrolase family 130 protein [Clostridia bacterium]
MLTPVLKSLPCVTRYENNPVLTKNDVPYDCDLVFNAGVIRWKEGYAVAFRNDYGCTQSEWESGKRFKGTNIGLAFSPDGIRWQVEPEPIIDMKDGEILRAYDPRLTVIGDEVFMTFAVDTRHGLRGGIARTRDLRHYEVVSLSVPDNRNMVLFPETINGMYMRLERPMPVYSRGGKDRFDIWISESPDLIHWGRSELLAGVEDFPFANDKVGPGAPPVKTNRGWLVFTHAVDRDDTRGKNGWEEKWTKRYCAGVMLLDLLNPYKVLGICRRPLLAPEAPYETTEGFRTNVIFPTAAILEDDGTAKIYYGASDTVTALATAKAEDLIEACLHG